MRLHKLTCIVCGKGFEKSQSNAKICSAECRRKRQARKSPYGKYSDHPLPTPTIGSIGEMSAAIYLLKQGYSVFRALSPACFCDLIAIRDTKILRIECRTGYRQSLGSLNFPKNKHGEIDIFAVSVISENVVLYIDANTLEEVEV